MVRSTQTIVAPPIATSSSGAEVRAILVYTSILVRPIAPIEVLRIKSPAIFEAKRYCFNSLLFFLRKFISFSDDIYIRDFKTNEESVFFRFKYETDEKLDIIKMKLNQEESYLGMINKKDKSFWLLKTDYLVNIDNLVD